jgi:small subunit ribosomal protein S17
MTTTGTTSKKTLRGRVVSNAMDKTVVVAVERYVKHPKYQKFYKRTARYKAHAPGEKIEVGTLVTIRETRPLSKDKHFEVVGEEAK